MAPMSQSSKLRTTTPVFLVRDIAATLDCYEEHLGFTAPAIRNPLPTLSAS